MRTKIAVIFFLVILTASFGLLGYRLYYLQHNLSGFYQDNSRKQQYSVITESPQRGNIVDRRGRILAASNKIESVFVEPRALCYADNNRFNSEKVKIAANSIQKIIDIPGNEICKLVEESSNPGFLKIKEGITPEQARLITEARPPATGVVSEWRRHYPMGELAGHIIGFIGADQSAYAGAELFYDKHLRGTEGSDVLFLDAMRRPIGIRPQESKIVVDGNSIVLTIDATIQQFTRQALLRQCQEYRAESGVAIVMDPWTGAILAMVSLPDFDPANFSKADPKTLRNRALTDPYEPGSIFKPIVAAVALDCGAISYGDRIDCENGYYAAYRIGEFGNHRYGSLTVKEILAQSSNIGMAKIGQKIGKKRLYDGVKLFGFGSKTGIDLPGEDAGLFYPTQKWSGYSVTRIPFGHEISVTGIQIARAFCTLANGGRYVKPHLLRARIDESGKMVEVEPQPVQAGYIVKPEVAEWIVRKALTAVVTEGTGQKAAIDNVEVFGKTGTANIAGSDVKGYDVTNYVASFVGGAPADKPKVIILVSIRKPDKSLMKGYTGGTVAAPVFKEILEKTLAYIDGK